MTRPHVDTRQLPGDSQHDDSPELSLVAIEVAADARIFPRDADLSALDARLDDAFVENRDVACRSAEHLHKRLRRGEHVVEQSQFAQFDLFTQMEPKKLIMQGSGDQIEELNLIPDSQVFAAIFDLAAG